MNPITQSVCWSALLPALLLCPQQAGAFGDEGLIIQSYSVSDPVVPIMPGDDCAFFLKLLKDDYNYRLLFVTPQAGQAGALFTLEDAKKDIALIQCGADDTECSMNDC